MFWEKGLHYGSKVYGLILVSNVALKFMFGWDNVTPFPLFIREGWDFWKIIKGGDQDFIIKMWVVVRIGGTWGCL